MAMVGLSSTAAFGQAIGQSAASALFFERVGTDALPVMYLLQGGIVFALMLVLAGVFGRIDRRRAYLAGPITLAALVLAERAVLLTPARWIYPVLWLTVPVAILVQTVFVWGTAGATSDTRQAKRLFPLFAAGGILGSVLGGLLTRPLVQIIGSEDLVVVWGASIAVGYAFCRLALPAADGPRPVRARRRRSRPSGPRDLADALRYVMRSPLLAWMTVAAILFSVLFYSLFLPWATAATERYASADDLAGFLGLFWAATTGLAFLVSVLATNRLFARFGIASMVMVLPLLYAGSFGLLVVTSTFVTLVAVRFVDGVWLQGVASPGWETLTNVVPGSRRDQVRAFLNGGPSQAGTAIAGVIALVGNQVLSARQLAVVGLLAAALTAYTTWRIRRSYASALVEALRAGRPHVFTDAPVPGVAFAFDGDAQALASVLDAAGDEIPSVRRLAVQLLGDIDDDRARSVVRSALHDADPGVRREAVVALVPGSAAADLEPADPELGDLELEAEIRTLVGDPDAAVAAAAAAALVGRGADPSPAERLRALVGDPDPTVRRTALEHLSRAPTPLVWPLAVAALDDRAPAVRAAALGTLAAVDPDAALGSLVRMLEDPSPRVREAAARAAVSVGERSVDPLLEALERPAARDAALRALAGLDLGGVERDGRATSVRGFADARAAEASRDGLLAAQIRDEGPAADLLRAAVLDRGRRSAAIALRALSLVTPDGPTLRVAIESLGAPDPAQVANALETLEATAGASVVRPLLPLWETTDGRAAGGSDDWLERIRNDHDGLIASCGELVLLARRPDGGRTMTDTTMLAMERVLFLRKVPLFEALAPADLHAIAEIAEEETFGDGEPLGLEGETGDELYIIVNGTVRVERGGSSLALRGPGDVVGEMSLITRTPRIATLVADGDVRAVRIGRREFESMVHDRPDIALGVMRVLAERLGELGAGDPAH
jgi:HEAT repeat protein